ncbi:MAG: pilus assembly protein PilY [Gammaproteobacteria bacterium]|nr:pilus assembly protein PilY [Gammaproteobacteria bacterium]
MMNRKRYSLVALLTLAAALPLAATAQTVSSTTNYTENFTGTTTNNPWYFSGGACLTASTAPSSTGSPGQLPGCTALQGSGGYYAGDALIGGNKGNTVAANGNTLPDKPTQGGALRFTNNNTHQRGAIISNFSFPLAKNGLKVSFVTETYYGNGADGISFFLQDASQLTYTDASAIGSVGGSLGYSCTNDATNAASVSTGFDGIVGGYLAVGIDEYGNFVNPGDNTSSGPGFNPNVVGLRGAGSTAWSYLSQVYPSNYPSTLTAAQKLSAVYNTCHTGFLWDYGDNPTGSETSTKLPNYGYIAYKKLTNPIAKTSAHYRGYGTSATTGTNFGVPITYNLTITPAGLLSLAYSYNGGAFQPIITGQDITQYNTGPIPQDVRFGFTGSTGGLDDVHEVMCFQASPQNASQSSAGLNQKQTAKVQTGTQVYFAFYNASNWTGSLTSQYLYTPTGSNTLQIDPVVNWDASCVLTGGACATTGATGMTAEAPSSRVILSFDGSKGIPFEWSNLTAAEQSALDTGDTSPINANRLQFLRGDRTNEQNSHGVGLFRTRTSVLGDIIDSSPTWVGPPSSTFPATWKDILHSTATMPENASGAQSYASFMTTYASRPNLVYAGANDGLLHGFRSGAFNSSGAYDTSTVPNDGYELLAFMPGYVVDSINAASTPEGDYSNPLYAHQFSVDAPPGVGDLFYANAWHTWLVGGLGPGGNAIYALDITDPTQFSETNAATTVIGEWSTVTTGGTTTSTLSCANTTNCGNNLGNTYGDPQIRRFHNGAWGAVFGNGFNSSTGDAGIYVMSVNPTTGAQTFYYLSTGVGSASSPNGIAYVTPADLDGDHVVDYVYAGDLQGNVWRFDLTSSDPTQWSVTSNPLYTTPAGQPITTRLSVALVTAGGSRRVMVEFGTGQQTPLSTISPSYYQSSQQALYGIWDWNMGAWNTASTAHYASLPTSTGIAAPTASLSGLSSLQQQTITATYDPTLVASASSTTPASAYYYRTVSTNAICWADTSGCGQYGWYLNLTTGYANPTDPNGLSTTANTNYPTVWEQVIFNPVLQAGAFIVNTTIPPTNSLATCAATPAGGWTMALNPATGGAFTSSFFGDANHNFLSVNNQSISGIALSGTGSPSFVTQGKLTYMITQTVSGTGAITAVNPQGGTKGTRLTWIEKR